MSIDFPNMTNGIAHKEAIIFCSDDEFLSALAEIVGESTIYSNVCSFQLACSMETLFTVYRPLWMIPWL